MKYEADAATKGGGYNITYYVGTTEPVTLLSSVPGASHSVPPAGRDVWTDQPEPTDDVWTWNDVSTIRFRVVGIFGRRGTAKFKAYEAWVTVYYTPPPEIFIDPSSVSTVEEFHVDLNISNVENLHTWNIKLSWNQSLFECAKAEEGTFLSQDGLYATVFTVKIYNDQGYILLADSRKALVFGAYGSGTLASVYFTSSLNSGNCSLHLYDTVLIGPYGDPITHTTEDGDFNNQGLPTLPEPGDYSPGGENITTVNPYIEGWPPFDERYESEGPYALDVVLAFDEEAYFKNDYYIPIGEYYFNYEDYAVWQIERGDEALVALFGIDIRIRGITFWYSDDSKDFDPLLLELYNELGHLIGSRVDGARIDVLLGFTMQETPSPTAGGRLTGKNVILFTWQEYWADDNLIQHEVSHLFGAHDHLAWLDIWCAMSYYKDYVYYLWEDAWWWVFNDVHRAYLTHDYCDECHNTIYSNRKKYSWSPAALGKGGSLPRLT